MASDDQMFDSSPGGNALEIIGALLGGGSGRPLGGGLMALGNMFNKRAFAQFEKANRPKELKQFVDAGAMSQEFADYAKDLPFQSYQPIQQDAQKKLFSTKSQQPSLMGWWRQEHPKGTAEQYEALIHPQKPTKAPVPKTLSGEAAEVAQQLGIPLDPTKQTPAQAAAWNRLNNSLAIARRPTMNVNMESPVSPADISPPPPGISTPGAVLMRDKSGHLTVVPSPIGPRPKEPTPKQWTINDFLTARGKAMAQAKTELTRPGVISKGIPSGPAIQARANDLLAQQGINPVTGKQLKNGEKVRLSSGKVATWSE